MVLGLSDWVSAYEQSDLWEPVRTGRLFPFSRSQMASTHKDRPACLFAQLVSGSTQLALAALCLPLHRRGCKLCSICCLALAPAAANSSSAVSITVSIISGCNCCGTSCCYCTAK